MRIRGDHTPEISKPRVLMTSGLALILALSSTAAFATIDNTATVNGTGPSGPVSDTSNTVNIPVATPSRDLDIAKAVFTVPSTASGTSSTFTDGGDTIVYRYTVTNTGNITETNIVVNESGPTFDGIGGGGTWSGFSVVGGTGTQASLAPGETVIFENTYTMTDADAFRAAAAADPSTSIDNSATADSDDYTMPGGDASTVETGVTVVPSLNVAKTYAITTDGGSAGEADVGDVVTYTYVVTNDGNVPITAVSISDDHENGGAGAAIFDSSTGTLGTNPGEWSMTQTGTPLFGTSTDGTTDVIWDSIAVGDAITFTYIHTVTKAEFDDQ